MAATARRSCWWSSAGGPLAPMGGQHCAAILLAWVPGDFPARGDRRSLPAVEPGGPLAHQHATQRWPGAAQRTATIPPAADRTHWATTSTGRRPQLAVRLRPGLTDLRTFEQAARGALGPRHHDGDSVTISVDVTNIGERTGDEVVQLYVRDEEATVARPSANCGVPPRPARTRRDAHDRASASPPRTPRLHRRGHAPGGRARAGQRAGRYLLRRPAAVCLADARRPYRRAVSEAPLPDGISRPTRPVTGSWSPGTTPGARPGHAGPRSARDLLELTSTQRRRRPVLHSS